jgi:hypothetical protein
MQYKIKAVETGHDIEVTRYSKPITRGTFKRTRMRIKNNKMQTELSEAEREDRHNAVIKNSLSRTKTNLRRLINSNTDLNKFYTLTFNQEIKNLNIANPIFMKFIQRFKYKYPDIKYIAVPEFMPRSGRVHYHLLLNVPYIDSKIIEKIWGNGFVKIKKLYEATNMGAYMSKYLTKKNFDKRYKNKKKFFYSKDCKKPKEYYGIYAEALYDQVRKITKPIFEKTFIENIYVGQTIYSVFDISKHKKLFNL